MAGQQLHLEALLAACLDADNQVRKQAEEAFKQLSQHPSVVPELVKCLQASHEPQLRQLAAVLLRKRVAKHWASLSCEVQTGIQAVLLQQLASEPVHSVQRAVADAVGAVAKLTLPQQQWSELLGFLYDCSRSGNAGARETALLLFGSLAESIGVDLLPHLSSIQSVILAGLADSHAPVQLAALAALEPLLGLASASPAAMAACKQLVAGVVELGQRALQQQQEEVLVPACEALMEATEGAGALMQEALPATLGLVMAVAGDVRLDDAARQQALQLLEWLARYKSKQLAKQGPLLKQAITGLCHLMCQPGQEDGEEDADEPPLRSTAAEALDVLSIFLPSQHVMPAAWAFIGSAAACHSPHERAGALVALTMLAEGCAHPLRKRLKEALPLVLAGLKDPAHEVRGAAAAALSAFADYLQPDISERYEQVLPAVFQLLSDHDQGVQARGLHALETFCEALEGSEIKPYVSQLMQALLSLLHTSAPAMQERALGCISSVALAAGKSFQQYAESLVPILAAFMQQTQHLGARCKATECVGVMADALGPGDVVLQQALPGLLELTLQGFQLDSNELREYSHCCLYNSAKALQSEFAPWLARAVPLAIASCRQEDGFAVDDGDGSSEDGHGDGDGGEDGQQQFRVRTGVLDEKAAATCALGLFAESTGGAFMPYVDPVLDVLAQQAEYFHEYVRVNAFEALQRLALAVHAQFPSEQQQQRMASGAAAGTSGRRSDVSSQTRHVLDRALPFLIRAPETDMEKSAVAGAMAATAAILKGVGVRALSAQQLEKAAAAVESVLSSDSLCQSYGSDDDSDADEDEAGHTMDSAQEDEELLEAATELLTALAHTLDPGAFTPLFEQKLLPALLLWTRPNQPDGMRAQAMGAAAEVCEALGASAAPVVGTVMPVVLNELRSEDATNRQNAAFCSGILASAAPREAALFALQLLQALAPLFGDKEEPGARDNAVGAVGRLLLALGGALPLEQVVPTFVAALPLQEDVDETLPACKALAHLLGTPDLATRVASCVPKIVQAFGQIAAQHEAPAEAKALVAHTLANLHSQYPQHVGPLLAALPAEQQAALQQHHGASS